MHDFTWEEFQRVNPLAYNDVIVRVTDDGNKLYVSKKGNWILLDTEFKEGV